MAQFYSEEKFNLKKDWNWGKIFVETDEWVHQEGYDRALNHILEYLEIGEVSELTRELLDDAQALISFLETKKEEGGMGLDPYGVDGPFSPTFYAYYSVINDWTQNDILDEYQNEIGASI
tara:strand:+ start:486 stop:845 length:360 start_codon:yes stop_codon:yes gene_type:complete